MVMKHWGNDDCKRTIEFLEDKSFPVLLCSPQIPYKLPCERTESSAVGLCHRCLDPIGLLVILLLATALSEYHTLYAACGKDHMLWSSVISLFAWESSRKCDVCLSVHRCICIEKKDQLDATEWFIALIICSTCFGHFYAHHQELETICVLLPPMVCDALVAGGWRSGARQPAMRSGRGLLLDWVKQHPLSWTHSKLSCTWPPTTSNQGIAHHRR